MSLVDQLLSFIAPHECLGCGIEGSLICSNCSSLLKRPPDRCYRCRKLSTGNITCRPCRSSSRLDRVHVATQYYGVAKDIVWELKFHGAQSAAKEMAMMMVQNIKKDRNYVIIPVPTASSRVRRRGYDQANLLAKELSRLSRSEIYPCLRRTNQAHQVGAGASQRRAQLKNAFRVTNPQKIIGKDILLIDDVVTTGATLEAAATILRSAGAKRVEALIYSQP